MIKLQMHETTLEGKPLPDTGRVISGEDAYEVVEAMKLQSPFTAEMTQREYIDNILSKIMPSKEAAEIDATEFLTKLAERGFLSFLPAGEPPVANCANASEAENYEEGKPCADSVG